MGSFSVCLSIHLPIPWTGERFPAPSARSVARNLNVPEVIPKVLPRPSRTEMTSGTSHDSDAHPISYLWESGSLDWEIAVAGAVSVVRTCPSVPGPRRLGKSWATGISIKCS